MTKRSLILVVIVLLAMPSLALADSATSNETLTIEASITMTGVPATIDYGSGAPGDRLQAGSFTIHTQTNSYTGATLTTNGLGFDVGGGFDSFGAEARLYHVDGIQEVLPDWEWVAYDGDETTFQDVHVGTWMETSDWVVTLAVDVPNTGPNTATSQVTFAYEVNP